MGEPENAALAAPVKASAPSARRHAKNALALTLSGVATKILVFASSVIIIRKLPLDQNGVFQLVFGFGLLYSMVSELGLRGLMLREVSRAHQDPALARSRFGDALNARLVLALLAAPVMAAVLWLAGYDYETVGYALCFGLYGLLDSTALFLKFGLRPYNRMGLDAVASISGRAGLLVGVGALALAGQITLVSITAVHILSAALECAGLAFAMGRTGPLRMMNPVKLEAMRQVALRSIPFAAVTLLGMFYLQTGAIALSLLINEEAVALLRTASKIPEAALFVPVAIVSAFLPTLARLQGDLSALRRYFSLLCKYLGLGGIAIGAVCAAEPGWILSAVFKAEYSAGTQVLRLLGVWVPLVFLQHVMVNMQICLNLEKTITLRYAAALTLNVTLNWILIPKYGVVGAGLALVLSEAAGVTMDLAVLGSRGIVVPGRVVAQWGLLAGLLGLAVWTMENQPPLARIAVMSVICMGVTGSAAWFGDRTLLKGVLRPGLS